MPLRGDRLRQTREKRGLTQRELAQLCGINDHQIFRYENGKADPMAASLEQVARHLQVSTDYLLGLSDSEQGQFVEELTPDQRKLLEAYAAGDSVAILEIVTERLRQHAARGS